MDDQIKKDSEYVIQGFIDEFVIELSKYTGLIDTEIKFCSDAKDAITINFQFYEPIGDSVYCLYSGLNFGIGHLRKLVKDNSQKSRMIHLFLVKYFDDLSDIKRGVWIPETMEKVG
jgi:hypothetical protein